jgi:hypothetical protein
MEIKILLLLLIILAIFVLLGFSIYLGYKKCKPFVQVYSGCPYVPDDTKCRKNTDNDCFKKCDTEFDLMYNKCKNDEDCLRKLYELKFKCYEKCL